MRPALTRKLVLEEAVAVPDGAGGVDRSWSALGTLWAELKLKSGMERAGDNAGLSRQRYRVILRAAPSGAPSRPRPDQRFREGTRIFTILAVADWHLDAGYLVCEAEEEVVVS